MKEAGNYFAITSPRSIFFQYCSPLKLSLKAKILVNGISQTIKINIYIFCAELGTLCIRLKLSTIQKLTEQTAETEFRKQFHHVRTYRVQHIYPTTSISILQRITK